MLRDSSFLENVPEDHRKLFVDGAPVAPAKLKVLKDMIRKKFSVNQTSSNIIHTCRFYPFLGQIIEHLIMQCTIHSVHLKRFYLELYFSL